MNLKKISLTVIIPFYNESSYIQESIERVLELDIVDEIILSDDCSTDGSEKIAKEYAEKYKVISYIRSSENLGKGNALINSKNLISSSHVIIHDADLEYFPEDIIEMYQASLQNEDALILGSRFIGIKERKNVYIRTLFANKAMSLFFSLVNFIYVSDVATCYKLIPSKFFKTVDFKEKGFSIEIELLSKFLKYKRHIIEIPITYQGRSYSEGKKIKTFDGFKYLLNTLKYRFFN